MKAKSIIENKFWILEEDNGDRVGTVSLKNNKVVITIKDYSETFSNLEELSTAHNVRFVTKQEKIKTLDPKDNEIYDYPTTSTPFNALWNLEMKIPIYTKTIKSNSYHCAGYYIIQFDTGWVKSFCPKLITIQRYPFKGPFKDKLEMLEQLRIHNGSD
jgi:hypothetical protein